MSLYTPFYQSFHLILVVLMVISAASFSYGQVIDQSPTTEKNKSSWELYISLPKQLNASPNRQSNWGYGFGVARRSAVSNAWDIHTNLHYLRFRSFDQTQFLFHLGPSFKLLRGEAGSISVHGRGGPAGIIGNDYAGFFASFNLGLRFTKQINRSALFMEIDWAHGMAFHPGNFRYLSLSMGWSF